MKTEAEVLEALDELEKLSIENITTIDEENNANLDASPESVRQQRLVHDTCQDIRNLLESYRRRATTGRW